MIWTPDRLADVVAAIERGDSVDIQRVATLQSLDLVRIGRQFVMEACEHQEARDKEAADVLMQMRKERYV